MTRNISPTPGHAPAPAHVPAPISGGGRYAGLDGLRAIAVALVVAYHLFPGWLLPQGFIGVDVFFVISGFLITSLLLREAATSEAAGRGRRISLIGFWRRRARRLLPALVTLIVVCGLWAWTIGGDVLVGFGRQVLGALTFSFNWISISAGSGYFDAGTPELFRNLWSLAVEEQFYVLWPLLFPLLLLIPSRVVRSGVAVVAASASALWMAVLVSNTLVGASGGVGVTRAYFGTDSHGFGILLGVALAFAAGSALGEPAAWMLRAGVRHGVSALGTAAVVGVVALAAVPPAPDTATFPGALLVACLLTVVGITAGAWPGSALGRALDLAPLRYIGQRSYGIYLWHWPVLVLLMAALSIAPGADVPLEVGLGALALSLGAAIVSYRFLETPVRRNGFRASFASLRARLSGAPAGRFAALAAVTAFVLAAGATTSAIAIAPDETSAATAVDAGQQALDSADVPSGSPTPAPAAESRVKPPLAVPTGDEPVPGPRPVQITGDQVSAIGDSVMLASAPGLMERLPGIQIDASVSRSLNAGVGIIEAQAAAGQLRPYVVVALGTNGPITAEALDRLERAVGPDRHVVLVNAFAPRDWIAGVNAELAAFDAAQPGVVIADWAGAAAAHADLLSGDGIHPGPTGGRLFAETVATAVQGVENARAQAAFDRSVRVSALASRLVDGLDAPKDDGAGGADTAADGVAGGGRGVSADLPER